MEYWSLCSYMGLLFAVMYRIPQIVKIRKLKTAKDLSVRSYTLQMAAYLSFLVYLVGASKMREEWVLCLYYVLGIVQNIVICALKKYYALHGGEDHAHAEGA